EVNGNDDQTVEAIADFFLKESECNVEESSALSVLSPVSIQQESVASDFGREVNGNDDQTVEAIADLFLKESEWIKVSVRSSWQWGRGG
ncbi:hypothetical protein F8388_025801, partial [Cannabis sativa]